MAGIAALVELGGKAEPGGEIAAAGEARGVADSGDEPGPGQRPDAGHAGQQAGATIARRGPDQAFLRPGEPFAGGREGLVQRHQLRAQGSGDLVPARRGDEFREPPLQMAGPFRQHEAELRKKAPQRVAELGMLARVERLDPLLRL